MQRYDWSQKLSYLAARGLMHNMDKTSTNITIVNNPNGMPQMAKNSFDLSHLNVFRVSVFLKEMYTWAIE